MIKTIISVVSIMLCSAICIAQNVKETLPIQSYGKIDRADLVMKECDFEKDANAMVFFDNAKIYFDDNYNIVMERHKRIKIFNANGSDEANIRIEYYGGNKAEDLTGVQAQTINLNNDKIELIKVDNKSIYTEVVDKNRSATVFSFPQVKPGTVIEYKYRLTAHSIADFPDWYFQGNIPTRYSQLETTIPDAIYYKNLVWVNHPFSKNTETVKALANIPSLSNEPFMSSREDNLDRILFQLTSIRPTTGLVKTYSATWEKVGEEMLDNEDFGGQLKRKLSGEEALLAQAKMFNTDEAKIAFIFNQVKNVLKWNHIDRVYTSDGTVKVWEKKTGNSTEINLILCHLLKQAGLNVFPMVVSTREHGKINPAYPNHYQFNRTVAYIPVDSTKNYVLDATSKHNCYLQIPDNLLNSCGLYMDKARHQADIIFLKEVMPAVQQVNIGADIKADGTMEGVASIRSYSYQKLSRVMNYQTDGEKNYVKFLSGNDNNLKIDSLKMENMESDSLPLIQKLKFKQELTSSDEKYIYFNPNLFCNLSNNPFLNEHRTTSIDFGHLNDYYINGFYKIPAGYKVDVLPVTMSLVLPDRSITFKRTVVEQDNNIVVRYAISFSKSIYFKEEYSEIHAFYKKMYEMLNEQVVLKKA